MSENWDEFGEDELGGESIGEQTFAPDDTHVGKIVWAGIQKKDWAKADRNPEGKVLTVKIEVAPKYLPIWESIPCHQRGRVEQLCRSARIDPPRGVWSERQLKDCTVTIETVLAMSKAGNEFVKVVAWKPGPEPLPKAVRESAPARTPAAKVRAASPSIGGDDIPF